MIVYDVEIEQAILGKYEERLPDIRYCDGWRDFEGMGISVICAYDSKTERYHAFTKGNFEDFQWLVDRDSMIVSFNGLQFDDNVCKASGINVRTTYDILKEAWVADGHPPTYESKAQMGYGLDDFAKALGYKGKVGHGAQAPINWQMGFYGKVITYCLEDVRLTWRIARWLVPGVKGVACLPHPKRFGEELIMPAMPASCLMQG